jgi:hypothetical protein
VDAPVRPSEIDVPDEFLEDLYVHPLIITPDYVGADRRMAAIRPVHDRVGHGSALRAAEILAVVVVTLSVGVPLTLLASHAAVAGTASHPPAAYLPSSPRTLGTAATLRRAATGYRSQAARSAARAQLARQREARRAAARQADASRQHEARAARVRRQAAVRHEARIRRQELVRRARARKR